MTWKSDFADIIHRETRVWPDDMPLSDRIKGLDELRRKAMIGRDCSWGRKAWQAARRDYLVRFGYVPKTKKAKERAAAVVGDLPLFCTPDNKDAE